MRNCLRKLLNLWALETSLGRFGRRISLHDVCIVFSFFVEECVRNFGLFLHHIELFFRIFLCKLIKHLVGGGLSGPVDMEIVEWCLKTCGQHSHDLLIQSFLCHYKLTISVPSTSNSFN